MSEKVPVYTKTFVSTMANLWCPTCKQMTDHTVLPVIPPKCLVCLEQQEVPDIDLETRAATQPEAYLELLERYNAKI